jgi:hypothetical protein
MKTDNQHNPNQNGCRQRLEGYLSCQQRLALMRTFLKYTGALFATYMVAWSASYVFMFISRGDPLDFRYYWEYFKLAWTFNGLEVPSFIWLFSIVAFLPLAALLVSRRLIRVGSA